MSAGPSCPECSGVHSSVLDSRNRGAGYEKWRRRQCLGCGHRFTTRERVENDVRGPARDRRVLKHFKRVLNQMGVE